MSRITNEVIVERIDNFSKNISGELKEIKEHVKATNGKIATAQLKIAQIETKQTTCPARNNYNDDKKEIKNDFSKRDKIKREILMWSPTAILTIFTIVTFIRGS